MTIRLKDVSIKKKLTAAFIAFILLPTFLLCSYSYGQVQQYIRSEIISSSDSMLEQMKYNIMNKLEIIESVSSNLCYNSKLESFLNSNFTPLPHSIDEYINRILPIVEYAMLYHKVSINGITIYMNNDSIPEGFGCFEHESALKGKKWYENFIQSKKDSAWILLEKTDLNNQAPFDNPHMFTFVQKIFPNDGHHAGIAAIDITQSELFSSLNSADDKFECIYLFSNDGKLLFSGKSGIIPLKEVKQIHDRITAANEKYVISGDNMYLVKPLEPLELKLCMLVSISNKTRAMNSLILTIAILILFILSMIIAFFIILRKIFSTINRQLKLMEKTVQNDFESRIPIDRKDELGQIAMNFNILLDKINVLLKDLIKKETAHRDAQFKALQFQINPHFIYNTLDIYVNKLAMAGNCQIADSIADFGKMLRYNIDRKSVYTTLEMELDYVKSYIGIQKLRYENNLNLTCNVPDGLLSLKVIKFILQPVVENSIMHNFPGSEKPLEICIDARVDNGKLVICISDNGKGITPKKLEELNYQFRTSEYVPVSDPNDMGIGLQNINERLKLFYGSDYYISIDSVCDSYTRTILPIPYKVL